MKRPIVWLMTFALTFSGSAMTVYAMEDIPIDSKAHTEDAAEIEEAGEYERVTERL